MSDACQECGSSIGTPMDLTEVKAGLICGDQCMVKWARDQEMAGESFEVVSAWYTIPRRAEGSYGVVNVERLWRIYACGGFTSPQDVLEWARFHHFGRGSD